MANEETQILDYHERNNRFWWHPEYMEDYWLKNGYEWRDWLLQPKIDPRSLNDGGIPTNDYNMPAQPGLNMMPLNGRLQVGSKYLDQCNISGYVVKNFDGSWGNLTKIPLINKINSLDEINHEWYGGNMKDILNIEELLRKKVVWKTNWEVRDWLLVVPQEWNYIIYYMIEFFHDKNRDHINAHYKMYAELTAYDKDGQHYIDRSAKYTITLPNYTSWMTIAKLESKTKLGLNCILKAEDNCFVRADLRVIKLSK